MSCCACQGIQIVLEWTFGADPPVEEETSVLPRVGWYTYYGVSMPWGVGPYSNVMDGQSVAYRWKNVGHPVPIYFAVLVETFHLGALTGTSVTPVLIEQIDTWSSPITVSVSDPDGYKTVSLQDCEVPYIP